MSTAAASALRKPVRQAVSSGYSLIPNSFFDHLPACLTPAAYVVLGQVLRSSKWCDDVTRRPEWARLEQSEIAERVGLSERAVRAALDEVDKAGCLRTRVVGRQQEYQAAVERFAEVPLREVRSAPRPEKSAAAPAPVRVPVAITCPMGLECPVEELVEGEDGKLRTHPLQTQGKGGEHRKCTSGVGVPCSGNGHRKPTSGVVQISPTPSTKADLKTLLVGRFGTRLATAPSDSLIEQTLKVLKGASLDHFAHVLDQRQAKVTSWGFIPHLAADCAGGKAAWEAAQTPARTAVLCRDCGADCSGRTIIDGRCYDCSEKADANWRAAMPSR